MWSRARDCLMYGPGGLEFVECFQEGFLKKVASCTSEGAALDFELGNEDGHVVEQCGRTICNIDHYSISFKVV